jgi:hypothetical protein
MDTAALRELLDSTLSSQKPHVEKLAIAVAVISEVLRQRGMEATLVGGGAIEFHASDIYTTGDIDLVVEGRTRADIDAAISQLGFVRRGRHWMLGELLVEVPGNWMSDPVEVVAIGPLSLRVVKREVVLADRIIGFKHWRATAYGAQAIALLALFGQSLDEDLLRERVRAEDATDALEALRGLAATSTSVTENELRRVLLRLQSKNNPPSRGQSE